MLQIQPRLGNGLHLTCQEIGGDRRIWCADPRRAVSWRTRTGSSGTANPAREQGPREVSHSSKSRDSRARLEVGSTGRDPGCPHHPGPQASLAMMPFTQPSLKLAPREIFSPVNVLKYMVNNNNETLSLPCILKVFKEISRL